MTLAAGLDRWITCRRSIGVPEGKLDRAGHAGLAVAERIEVIAPHPLARLTFAGCRVPADALLGTEDLTQAGYLAYAAADGYWFDMFDLANDLKIFAGW